MVFVIIAGGYLGFQTGWVGYSLPTGYFPFGVNGMLAGSATVFFAFIGFDSVASTAEEVKNPQRDLPLGIGIALSICCFLYMLVSIVIVGLVPYYAMDPDTPISSAFSSHGMDWAAYIITAGAVTALCSTLMGSILPQHGAAIVQEKMYIFGGNHNGRYHNDLHILDLKTSTWSKVETKAAVETLDSPSPICLAACADHSLILWKDNLLCFAGHTKDPSESVTVLEFD